MFGKDELPPFCVRVMSEARKQHFQWCKVAEAVAQAALPRELSRRLQAPRMLLRKPGVTIMGIPRSYQKRSLGFCVERLKGVKTLAFE